MPTRKTLDEFIADANKIHNNKYDYSQVEYKNNRQKVKIICPIHGSFMQTPHDHLSKKAGCPRCKGDAFYAYKKAKEDNVKAYADDYYSKGLIDKRVYDALYKYEINITD